MTVQKEPRLVDRKSTDTRIAECNLRLERLYAKVLFAFILLPVMACWLASLLVWITPYEVFSRTPMTTEESYFFTDRYKDPHSRLILEKIPYNYRAWMYMVENDWDTSLMESKAYDDSKRRYAWAYLTIKENNFGGYEPPNRTGLIAWVEDSAKSFWKMVAYEIPSNLGHLYRNEPFVQKSYHDMYLGRLNRDGSIQDPEPWTDINRDWQDLILQPNQWDGGWNQPLGWARKNGRYFWTVILSLLLVTCYWIVKGRPIRRELRLLNEGKPADMSTKAWKQAKGNVTKAKREAAVAAAKAETKSKQQQAAQEHQAEVERAKKILRERERGDA